MIASTCLAVLFVPSFYVVLQRFEERRRRGGATEERAQPAQENAAPSSTS
jgi:HAE1 family hydrophobic/amphiphilic exporter-1